MLNLSQVRCNRCGGNLWLEQALIPQLGRRGRNYTTLHCLPCPFEVEVTMEPIPGGIRIHMPPTVHPLVRVVA